MVIETAMSDFNGWLTIQASGRHGWLVAQALRHAYTPSGRAVAALRL